MVRRLTWGPGFDGEPTWSPDGSRIAFTTDQFGPLRIYTVDPDAPWDLTAAGGSADGDHHSPTYSPYGGSILLYVQRIQAYGMTVDSIWVLDQETGDEAFLRAFAAHPAWAPDGSRIAFVNTLAHDIQVMWMFNGQVDTVVAGAGMNLHPAWSPASPPSWHELVYTTNGGAAEWEVRRTLPGGGSSRVAGAGNLWVLGAGHPDWR